ncbi:signal recognition particle receptor subunit beta [Pseudohyphozyma bogoriensis]|nr:signal recognition particle receptor subunit beta [Pseudohyphozyma bogoriensis]
MSDFTPVEPASAPRLTPEAMSLSSPFTLPFFSKHLAFGAVFFVLFIAFRIYFAIPPKLKSRSKSSNTVLLVGPSASGKTALFARLLYGAAPQTHTSIKENEGLLKSRWAVEASEAKEEQSEKEELKDTEKDGIDASELVPIALRRPINIVDLPGHARLRTRLLAQFLPAADKIIFTVDAVAGLSGKGLRESAEHLHLLLTLLSILPPTGEPPKLLILLTKSDLLPTPRSSTTTSTNPHSQLIERAKTSLSRELDRRRASSTSGSTTNAAATLESLEPVVAGGGAAKGLPSEESEVWKDGEAFAFEGAFGWDKVEHEVEWAVAGVRSEKGVESVWDWLEL